MKNKEELAETSRLTMSLVTAVVREVAKALEDFSNTFQAAMNWDENCKIEVRIKGAEKVTGIPERLFEIGDIVNVKVEADQSNPGVITGMRVWYLEYFERYIWEYEITDRQSSWGFFEEENIEKVIASTDDQIWWITGGQLSFRDVGRGE